MARLQGISTGSGLVKKASSSEARVRITIAEVAADSGVSVSAVSKVLRDAYGVSEDMRSRVTASIERLGYRPRAAARAMRGSSFTVGVAVTSLDSPFQAEIAQSVSNILEQSRYHELLSISGMTAASQQDRIADLIDHQVDGLILIAPWMDEKWLGELAEKIPTVVIARHGGSKFYDSVVSDDFEGARAVVNHLVSLGHSRIAHTSQPSGGLRRPHVLSHAARLDGYLKAMSEHGLKPDVIETAYTEIGGFEAGRIALNRNTRPTAIFAGADIAALGVLRAAEEAGVRVPDDLSVAGYDNIYISTMGRVSLTTVDQSGLHTGEVAARLLLERLSGRSESAFHTVPTELIRRGTTGLAPRN